MLYFSCLMASFMYCILRRLNCFIFLVLIILHTKEYDMPSSFAIYPLNVFESKVDRLVNKQNPLKLRYFWELLPFMEVYQISLIF